MQQDMGDIFKTVRGYQLENTNEKKLTSAMEDYLEMLYRLCRQDGYARVGKLAEHLQVKPSSASRMVAKLVEMRYLCLDRNDGILLTQQGRVTGEYLMERHSVIERFFALLDIDAPQRQVELLEHTIEPETVKKLQQLLEFFDQNSNVRHSWQKFIER